MATSSGASPKPNSSGDFGFNPYHKWLGIRDGSPPYDRYTLLGLAPFEDDLDVIAAAADRQMAHVRTYQSGKHVDASQRVLNELAKAQVTLLKPDRKAQYDAQLRRKSQAVSVTPVRVAPASPSPVRSVGTNSAPSIVIAPQESRSNATSHPTERGRQRQSPIMWIVLGIASFVLIALIVFVANRRQGTPGSDPSGDAVADVNPRTDQRPNPNNEVENDDPQDETPLPNETGPTPEERERAEAEAERARALEAARRAEEEQAEAEAAAEVEAARVAAEEEAARLAEEEQAETEAETEAESEAARIQFNRDAWAKYQELKTRYANASIEDLLTAAQSEQDPATRP